MWGKRTQIGETLSLKLTAVERKLILDEVQILGPECRRILREAPSGQPVMMTSGELAALEHCLREQASFSTDRLLKKNLDRILTRIEELVEEHGGRDLAEAMELIDPDLRGEIAEIVHKVLSRPSPFRVTHSKRRQPPPKPTDLAFQLKITLLNIEPPIWRRIRVPDCTLAKLHLYIQSAMGWENCHLHQFVNGDELYGEPSPDGFEFGRAKADEATVLLSQVIPLNEDGFRFAYEYDFGDSWAHEILFERAETADDTTKAPACLAGERACPPEDIGGTWGYADYLDERSDPQCELDADDEDYDDEEHAEIAEYFDDKEPFDPEAFDPGAATRAMHGRG